MLAHPLQYRRYKGRKIMSWKISVGKVGKSAASSNGWRIASAPKGASNGRGGWHVTRNDMAASDSGPSHKVLGAVLGALMAVESAEGPDEDRRRFCLN